MMRIALLLLILVVAMLLGPILANHPGYVMLVVGGITIEATLVSVFFMAALAWGSLWLLKTLLTKLFHLPKVSFSFLRSRQRRRAMQALEDAQFAYVRGDWSAASERFSLAQTKLTLDPLQAAMASYAALQCNHGQLALSIALAQDKNQIRSLRLQSDVYMKLQQPQQVVALLQPIFADGCRDTELAEVFLMSLRDSQMWQLLLDNIQTSLQQKWFTRDQWQQLRFAFYPYALQGLAQQGHAETEAASWQALPAKERKSTAAQLGQVWVLAQQGQTADAEQKLLSWLTLDQLASVWPVLCQIPLGTSVVQLRKQIQLWLKEQGNHGYGYAVMAYCAQQEGETEVARQAWQKAISFQPALKLSTWSALA
jgi:uncharacterized protein HemY